MLQLLLSLLSSWASPTVCVQQAGKPRTVPYLPAFTQVTAGTHVVLGQTLRRFPPPSVVRSLGTAISEPPYVPNLKAVKRTSMVDVRDNRRRGKAE